MSRFGLQSTGNFTNSTAVDKNNVVVCQPRLFLSPSGSYVIRLDQLCNHQVYKTSNYERFPSNITYKFLSAAFHADDRYLYYLTPLRLVRYDLQSMSELILYSAQANSSNFNSLTFSQDFQRLYFRNFTNIHMYFNFSSNNFSSKIAIASTQSCNISYFKLQPGSSNLVTSSPLCYLCKWSEVDGKYELSKQLNLTKINPACQINQLFFKEDRLFVSKKYNVLNKVQIYQINLQNFTLNQTITRSLRYVNQWSYIVQAENYFLTYIGGLSTAWINKDILSNVSDSLNFGYLSFVKHSVYNPYKTELYHFMQVLSTNGTSNYIERSKLSFNCSQGSNVTTNKTNLAVECDCPQMQVFNKSTATCQSSACGYKNGPTCACPSNFIFNTFSQKCRLDCSSFQNSLLPLPTGPSSQCYCKYSYNWQGTQSGCVLNCSQIPFAFSSGAKGSCQCSNGRKWVNTNQRCQMIGAKELPIIDPVSPNPPTISNTQNPVGLTILFIVLSFILITIYIFLYYKKIKARLASTRDKVYESKQPKIEADDIQEPNTDRPLPKIPAKSEHYLASPSGKKNKGSGAPETEQNLQNFSIDEEDNDPQKQEQANENLFSQIQSNLQNPLQ